MKVYVVTHGEYSDYGISGIFSTREKANEYIEMAEFGDTWHDNHYIQEMEVDRLPNNWIPKADMVYYNEKTYTTSEFDDLLNASNTDYLWDEYRFDENDNVVDVVEVPQNDIDEYNNNLANDEDAISNQRIEHPIYVVTHVPFNKDRKVIDKIVYDRVAKYKVMKAGL